MATKDNIQTIYVAPQGEAGGTWFPSSDPQFFGNPATIINGAIEGKLLCA
jgi:hypothetical protein